MKNAFYFMLKSHFLLEILNLLRSLHFCPEFLVMQKNGVIKKIRLISKFMTAQTVQIQLQYTYHPVSQEVKAVRH